MVAHKSRNDDSWLWRWDADGVGSTGANVAAAYGSEGFAHADFDGGEVVVAAA